MKRILVTGASGGIGAAICRAFAAEDTRIAVHYYQNKTGAEALCRALRHSTNCIAQPFYADISDSASVNALFDAIQDMFGGLEILVNNAGTACQQLFTDMTESDWRNMLGVNLDGVFFCCHQALRRFMLPAHSGVICNISSMWGQVGGSCEVGYSAAKAGVIGLTKALAKEVGLSGIRVNCIAPGVILTDMMKGFDDETLNALRAETPLNRLGTPEDVAQAVKFFCSDTAAFVTGQVLGVNGGFVI